MRSRRAISPTTPLHATQTETLPENERPAKATRCQPATHLLADGDFSLATGRVPAAPCRTPANRSRVPPAADGSSGTRRSAPHAPPRRQTRDRDAPHTRSLPAYTRPLGETS